MNDAVLLWGASTFNHFPSKNSMASRRLSKGIYEETYNSSLLIDSIQAPKLLHKSKLVPGVEKIPFIGKKLHLNVFIFIDSAF